jgi:hypothetical protein
VHQLEHSALLEKNLSKDCSNDLSRRFVRRLWFQTLAIISLVIAQTITAIVF